MREADLYKKLIANLVECKACSHRCKIKEGRTGICGVRKNVAGTLYLQLWGKAVCVNIDPVEKKPLYHFLPGTDIFSIGTVGCNFSCKFCQNWDISQVTKKSECFQLNKNELNSQRFGYDITPKEVRDYCIQKNIKSIAFTYNEPTIFVEYALDTMKLAKKKGIKGVFVSNGFETEETLNYLDGYIDAYNIDLKAFTESFYQKVCGGRLAPVLDTIKSIHKRGKWLEITTLLIPGQNDSDEEINSITKFIAEVSTNIPWHISAFHPDYKMIDKEATKPDALFRAHAIGKSAGLSFIYTGNISDDRFSDTLCPICNTTLIKRRGYFSQPLQLKNGNCKVCKTKIPGIWE